MPNAPVVYDLTHQHQPAAPADLFELGEFMSATLSNKTLDDVMSAAWNARSTIDAGTLSPPVPDLLNVDQADLLDVVRQSVLDHASRLQDNVGYSPALRAAQHLTDVLHDQLRKALAPFADDVVIAAREQFDAHLKVIRTAADLDLSADTNPTDLLNNGSPKQVAAYRALPAAVAGLEQVATLRNNLTSTLRYGPADQPAVAFVGTLASPMALQSFNNDYADRIDWADYHQPVNGAAMIQVTRANLGGRWLRLVVNGYPLRLNTAAEAQAVLTQATTEPAA